MLLIVAAMGVWSPHGPFWSWWAPRLLPCLSLHTADRLAAMRACAAASMQDRVTTQLLLTSHKGPSRCH